MKLRFLAALTAASLAHAAPPGFESIYPAGAQAGSTLTIRVTGAGLEKSPVTPWFSQPGITAQPTAKPKEFQLTIPPDTPLGPCLVRFQHPEGSSPPRIFVIGKLPELTEAEPNDKPADSKQVPAANAVINGLLEKAGDVDSHPILAKKGQLLQIRLHGYALGSPMDPAIRLLDQAGNQLALAHDSHNLDPALDHLPNADARLYVQVMAFAHPPAADVSLKGSTAHVYRLQVTTLPNHTEVQERKHLTLPDTVHGTIAHPGQADTFLCTLKKGQELTATVRASTTGSLLDAVLRAEDPKGKTLQTADDGAEENLDPELKLTAAADGDYKLILTDRFSAGSPSHHYQLTLTPTAPQVTAHLDTHSYHLEPGKTLDLKLKVTVRGTLKHPLTLTAEALPPGVTQEPLQVPPKSADVTLKLKAQPTAPVSQQPIRLKLTTQAPDPALSTNASYKVPFTEPRGPLLLTTDVHPWLTVSKPPGK